MKNGDYFIGLDIGTNSIGWAVSDSSYNLIKFNGNSLWGARLFDEAQTAHDRRIFRTSRRRLQKRKQRINFLQEIFSECIGKVDAGFFNRLRESKFLVEDKQCDLEDSSLDTNILFADDKLNDKSYRKKYPTIYHLRKALIDDQQDAFDPRFVYLAIHHIYKHRGHFLYGDLHIDKIDFDSCIAELNDFLKDSDRQEIIFESEDQKKRFEGRLCVRGLISKKKEELLDILNLSKADDCYYLVSLLSGSKETTKNLFGAEIDDESLKSISLSDDFEENIDKYKQILGDHNLDLLIKLKSIYDWSMLQEIRSNEEFISYAKVKSFEKHASDLKILKKLLNASPTNMNKKDLILNTHECSYQNYVGHMGNNLSRKKRSPQHVKNNNEKTKPEINRCTYADFTSFLAKQIKELPQQTSDVDTILGEIKNESFLCLQKTKDNAVLPYQVHLQELTKILDNASKYPAFAFLSEKYADTVSVKDAIIKIFSFRVPYFVGPLNKKSPFAWVVRSDEKIYPWNFEKVVDLEKCAEKFITRMTAKCSYLSQYDVLPKNSLLYSRFTVLNELNNLKVSGVKVSVEVKQDIYNNLFKKYKKVTQTRLKDYLIAKGHMQKDEVISGIDGDFKGSLGSLIDLQWLVEIDGGKDIAEDVIKLITILGENKRILTDYITSKYGDKLNEDDIKKLSKLSYSGWGNLSSEFLTGIFHDEEGKRYSIIDMLWERNDNLMQLLSFNYDFQRQVDKAKNNGGEFSIKEYLDDAYVSPGVRRAIYQANKIVDEIHKIMKKPPSRIFVEMTRSEGEKKRTVSRRNQLEDLYRKCREDYHGILSELSIQSDSELRREVLYLYFLQQGKCMYSGERINIEDLHTGLYNVDHIYPQWAVKDDSLNNKVLVKTALNQEKSGKAIGADIKNKMKPFWKHLKDRHFISEDKYQRLIRSKPLTEEEKAGFINRQLVETSQATKVVANMFRMKYGDKTRVIYVKAGNVSDFRHDQRRSVTDSGIEDLYPLNETKSNIMQPDPVFVKCRELNNLHHAKDAYLNIVVGNVYNTKFTDNPLNFIKEARGRMIDVNLDGEYNISRVFDRDVIRNGYVAWRAGTNGSIKQVRAVMQKNNIFITRKSFERKGQILKDRSRKGSGTSKIGMDPRFSIESFGGYREAGVAYFSVIEYEIRGKKQREMISVFIKDVDTYENNHMYYINNILGLNYENIRIVISKIPIYTLFYIDKLPVYLSGSTGSSLSVYSAFELKIDPVWHIYIKNLLKFIDRNKDQYKKSAMENIRFNVRFDHISADRNVQLYKILSKKIEDTSLNEKFLNVRNKLNAGFDLFKNLDIFLQSKVLIEVIKVLKCDAQRADLSLINGSSQTVIGSTSKKSFANSAVIVHQSVTGACTKEIELSKL